MKIQILAVTALVLTATATSLTGVSMAQQAPAAVTAPQSKWTADSLAAKYQAEGYTRIEIKMGVTHAEVEAFKGSTKVEDTYELASGTVIKSETEQMAAGRTVTPGVFIGSYDDDHGRDDDDRHDDRDDRDDRDDDHGGHGSDDSGHHN